MRSLSHTSRRPLVALVTLCVAVIAVLGISLVSQANAKSEAASGQRLISLHEAGETRGILTDAKTLREAFRQADITVDPNDLVEPSLDHELVASQYDVNIYRTRPVTIVDGSVRTKISSPYQTATQIAGRANIDLHDEDITTMTANTDMASEGVGLQVVVQRATPFTLIMYGKKIDAYTQSTTVEDMLRKKNITLGSADTLSVAREAPLTAGMTVELWRNGTQTITEDQDIDFPVEQIKDADRNVGYKEVQTPGEKGKRTVSYEIEMKNGVEVSRKEIQSVTTKEPKQQIEVVGTKLSLPPGSHQDWMAAAGIAESDYGYVNLVITGESTWNPAAVSPNGYYGLGQTNLKAISSACPNWQSDPICQLRFFSGYANRYGGWEGSAKFWSVNRWW